MEMPERFAAISDVHGNSLALKAVLANLVQRGISSIVNLGDAVDGPLDPAGTADLLIAQGIPTVRGNGERLILDSSPGVSTPTFDFVRETLQNEHLRWLEGLPETLDWYDAFLFHASPDSDQRYLLWEKQTAGLLPRSPAGIQSALEGVSRKLVLCGHDHVPSAHRLPSGTLVVNPGSVGLQAYTDDVPCHHVMQAGSPHARYSILTRTETGWKVEPIEVEYDWESAAGLAERNGRPDWTAWLLSGLAV